MRKLEPSFHERIWGVTDLAPWFPDAPVQPGKPVGEVWFETPEVPLLVKFLFTREDLSVQVHPGDEYARTHHDSVGKTEMWHVVSAEPGARVAAGFPQPVTLERAREAALSGEIAQLLEMYPAAAGDTFFIPAGTVHAIGAGLTLCEIQQRSDITYRLYDYGRGRELQLDHALAVSRRGPASARSPLPISCPYFVVEKVKGSYSASLPKVGNWSLAIVIEGAGSINGHRTQAGDVWLTGPQVIEIADRIQVIRAYLPSR